jgi:hypothetical protein
MAAELSIEQALAKAIESHNSGPLQGAERFYLAILRIQS